MIKGRARASRQQITQIKLIKERRKKEIREIRVITLTIKGKMAVTPFNITTQLTNIK